MLNKFQNDFLKILSDYLSGNKTEVSIDNTEELYNVAQNHQLLPIVYHQCKDFLPKNTKAESVYFAASFYYTKRKVAIEELNIALKDIPHVFMKGAVISDFYPVPFLRLMGDVDVLVKPDMREAAHERLLKAGFKLSNKESNEVGTWNYKKHETTFELHIQLMHEEIKEDKMYNFFFSVWDYIKDNRIENTFHYLFMIAHIKEHLMVDGVGFRQFMDIAVATERWKDIDYAWLEETAEKLGFLKFMKTVLSLNEKWFGVKSPYNEITVDEEFFETVTEKIFNNGVFGFNDIDNLGNKAIRNAKENGKSAMLSSAFNAIFFPYDKLIKMPEYSFLIGKKWLLPYAWVYRIVIKWNKRKRIKSQYIASDKRINERLDYFDKWGI